MMVHNMAFALIAILIIGLALYETGYGVTNTLSRALKKQVVVQLSATFAFLGSCSLFFPSAISSSTSLLVNIGFLSMLTYIATAPLQRCWLFGTTSALIGGAMFPLLLHIASAPGILPSVGFVDYAGAGLIHFVGGAVALIAGVYISGGKEYKSSIVIRPYPATIGFLVLWAGWIAYVALISTPILQANAAIWLRGLINLSTATAWGAASAVVYMLCVCGKVKMRTCTVGGLAGMVAMSADPFSSPFWAAALTGAFGGIVATVSYGFLCKFKVTDPSNVISIHFLPGLVGLLAAPIFNTDCYLSSQLMGAAALLALASTVGVLTCELYNLTPKVKSSPLTR